MELRGGRPTAPLLWPSPRGAALARPRTPAPAAGQQTRAGPGTATGPLRARRSPARYLPAGGSPRVVSTGSAALLQPSASPRCRRCRHSGGDGEAEPINGSSAAPTPALLELQGRAGGGSEGPQWQNAAMEGAYRLQTAVLCRRCLSCSFLRGTHSWVFSKPSCCLLHKLTWAQGLAKPGVDLH